MYELIFRSEYKNSWAKFLLSILCNDKIIQYQLFLTITTNNIHSVNIKRRPHIVYEVL